TERPWFAIGGIDLTNLDQVLDAGARRVVVVRAITQADDPGAAAAELARRLREA
ncbi:MAG: thiamine phosphate synthase, partial [Actinobacteria bacterium]|nr:thiamine phosphate synthase [Actinomycetota bacterium]NIU65040.1 thiamine phosphate synthase [Actinomycetota bacterium]NIW26839.1 thiamine phosphate synthase [Actinomycetota bacterium]